MSNYQEFSRLDRWLITLAVMSATLMQVLDTTIVNVALPHMQGSLSATPDEITWVLTSYLVSSAIFMPLTGYFTDRLGRKNYLLFSISGFIVASALCGAASSITQIVICRLLQGVFGAALVPLSQAIMADIFSEEDRGMAMAIWGVGVMVGPILGPTLGGYLTEVASWRWTFYINVPVGILSFLIAWRVAPDTPRKSRDMDWQGLSLISMAIGATQYFLDRGNQGDWFSANDIRVSAILALIGFIGFIIHSARPNQKAVIDLRIFKDRNFVIASGLLAMFGLGLYGAMVILPLMLESLFNYPVLTTGLVMAPRGISGMIGMIIVGRLIKKIDPRLLISTGITLCVLGTYAGTYYNLEINPWWVIWPLLFQGIGLGMVFVPLSAVAFATLDKNMRAEAAGIFSLLRTIGSSIGISVIITLYTRHTQIAWNQLGGFIQPYNPALQQYLQSLHLKINDPLASALLGNELARQSQMVAFIDIYMFIAISFICMLPFVFILKKAQNRVELPAISHD